MEIIFFNRSLFLGGTRESTLMPTKKKTPKAAAKKKPVAKKRAAKKSVVADKVVVSSKQVTPKKAPAKKKVVAKKAVAKKVVAKKVVMKKVVAKKPTAKKSLVKDVAPVKDVQEKIEDTVNQVVEEALEMNAPIVTVTESKVTQKPVPVEVHRKIVYIGACRNCDHMPMRVEKLVAVLSILIAILSAVVIFGGPTMDNALIQLGFGSNNSGISSTLLR